MIEDEMEARWNAVAADLALPEPVARELMDELRRRYSEPHRFYHALPHVLSVLRILDGLTSGISRDDAVALRLAAWYHDVIYDTRARDNEEKSAQLMLERLQPLGIPAAILDGAVGMIRATANHAVPEDCLAAAFLLDADLAILGSAPDDYDRYADQIRREYGWAPEADYRVGRAQVLKSFLNRERIFQTPTMHGKYEMAAVENQKREIAGLERQEA